MRGVVDDLVEAHVDAFRVTFAGSAAIALLGALACLVLVRRTGRVAAGPILGRRSRWIYANLRRASAGDER